MYILSTVKGSIMKLFLCIFSKKNLCLWVIFLVFLNLNVSAKNQDVKVEKVVSGLGVPWGIEFISTKEILFTLRSGEIGIVNFKTGKIRAINGGPEVLYDGQGGLLDVALSPDFITSSLVYFTYVKSVNNEGVLTLTRGKLLKNKLINLKDIFVSKSGSNTSRHFGSRITFDDDNHVYFSIGDRGVRKNAHAGSIIRLNLDGSIPLNNPFVSVPNALPEIYSYGHRNPQGLFWDKTTKRLWSIEHGPRGGDEINLIQKGKNYGWPIVSYGKEYWSTASVGEGTHKKGMEHPIKVYIPSIAPSSLMVYTGDTFPQYKGHLFSGALKLTHLNRIQLDSNLFVLEEERFFESLNERVRDVIQSKDGLIYFSTDDGNIYRMYPSP